MVEPYTAPVTVTFTPSKHTASWHCDFCNEQVVHHHKPMKPTYEVLVTELRLLEEQISKHYQGGSTQLPPALNRETWCDLRNLLARVDNGR